MSLMLQPLSPDDQRRARLALLTDKERECLERWLTHATAKEIALELGVSHHAVEKRLKSARSKLGVGSTLEAARLLAASEGYGRTASRPPEVAATGPTGQSVEAAAAPPRRRGLIITGAIIMTVTLLTLALLAGGNPPASQTASQAPTPPEVMVINRASGQGQAGNADLIFGRLFARLDGNNSGFIEDGELAKSQFRVARARDGVASASDSVAVDIASWDKNADKRLSREEFSAGFAGLQKRR